MSYKRKTEDEFEIQGFILGTWEIMTTETTRIEARKRLKEYRENEPDIPYRIHKQRVKIKER